MWQKRLVEKLRSRNMEKSLMIFDKICVFIFLITYPTELVLSAIGDIKDFAVILLTSAVPFFILSVLRKLINAERPYVKYEFEPLLKKEKNGESFPSRHVFSAFLISGIFLKFNLIISAALLLVALLDAVIRVIGGVHFLRDVTVGALLGIVFSGITLLILQTV